MCLVAVARDVHPRVALAIVANRDEFHARPSEPAHWWREGWLAGRDLDAGGAWFGVRRDGRWALVTNVREPGGRDARKASRGEIVTRALAAPSVEDVLRELSADAERFNGYNLLAGEEPHAWWQSNRQPSTFPMPRGVTALSNAALGTPWPKVERLGAVVTDWARRSDPSIEPLFDALSDRTIAPDDRLPATGVTREWERLLSAAFIVSGDYGTRCSTVLVVGRDGNARFVERSFAPTGDLIGEVDERFALDL
ncbi:MAG: NRDE family protein [Betaproteobacteria bacterium]